MAYNLYVTRSNGTEFKTLRSPYPTRDETVSTVRTILTGGGVVAPDTGLREFARTVAAAQLGDFVWHAATGLTFRTEEVPTP